MDILSQGGDREPSPWPRRLAVIGALVLCWSGGSSISSSRGIRIPPRLLSRRRRARRPRPGPPASTGSAGRPCPGRPPSGRPPWERSPPGSRPPRASRPDRRPARRQLRLPVHPSRRRLGGAAQRRRQDRARRLCGAAAARMVPRRRRAVGYRVGTANQVAPAATAGALRLTSYPLGADARTAAGTAREVSLAWRAAWCSGRASARVRYRPGNRPRPAARAGDPATGNDGRQAVGRGLAARQPRV